MIYNSPLTEPWPGRRGRRDDALRGGKLSWAAEDMDKATGGAVTRAIAAGRFAGKPGQTVELVVPAGLDVQRLVVVGAGADWTVEAAERFAAQAFRASRRAARDPARCRCRARRRPGGPRRPSAPRWRLTVSTATARPKSRRPGPSVQAIVIHTDDRRRRGRLRAAQGAGRADLLLA